HHWLLGVHIADVSHFVPEGTALDTEAYQRATSVYLPDKVIPMLPEVISNNLASLQPHRVRYAVTCVIELTAEGVPVATEVYKSAIKSCRRFTYEEVDEYLISKGLTEPHPMAALTKKSKQVDHKTLEPHSLDLAPEVDQLLSEMFELAMILRKRR